jgi:hypothetical protein
LTAPCSLLVLTGMSLCDACSCHEILRARIYRESALLGAYQRYLQRLHVVVGVVTKKSSPRSQLQLGMVAL